MKHDCALRLALQWSTNENTREVRTKGCVSGDNLLTSLEIGHGCLVTEVL